MEKIPYYSGQKVTASFKKGGREKKRLRLIQGKMKIYVFDELQP